MLMPINFYLPNILNFEHYDANNIATVDYSLKVFC